MSGGIDSSVLVAVAAQRLGKRVQTYIDDLLEAVSTIDFYVDGSFGVFAKVGKMAAANNLVLREPYMDRAASDYLAGLPRAWKVKGGMLNLLKSQARTKYLLKC